MKKILSILLAMAMVFTLAACGAAPVRGNDASTPTQETGIPDSNTSETPSVSQPDSATPPENEVPEEAGGGEGKILIAYFSATNNTEGIANHLDTILDADLYEIVPETPYTSEDLNYNSDCRANREQNDSGARPAITGSVENMEQYDVIFLGYPIWWGQAPKIISTFLESYDFNGKTIVPFCTSGSSPLGSSAENLQELTDSVTWLEGHRFSGGDSQAAVESWVNGLNLKLTPAT